MLSASQDEDGDGGSIRIDAPFPTKIPHSEMFFRASREVQSIAGGWRQHGRLRKQQGALTELAHWNLPYVLPYTAQLLFAMTQRHPKSITVFHPCSNCIFSTMLNNVDVFHCYLFLVQWFMVLGLIARVSRFPVGLLTENISWALNSTTQNQSVKARFAFNLCFTVCASNLEE